MSEKTGEKWRVYKRRWFILLIFVLYSASNTWQWIQYSIIGNVVMKYYGVDSYAVDWTSIIFMLAYVPVIFPVATFLDRRGLRVSILIGAAINAAGTWVKVVSIAPDRFWVAFVGQTMGAIAQVYMLSIPPHLASVWFGSDQVSTACSLGVFGNQFGVAASFLLNPLLIRNHESLDDIGRDMLFESYCLAGFSTIILILVIFFFRDKPPVPPSKEAMQRETETSEGLMAPMKRLLRKRNFNFLLLSYGISLGVLNAVSTLLNQIILVYFESGEEFAGRVGLLFIVGGMVGAVICGIILDKTHKFKETTVGLYVCSLLSMVAYTFVLSTSSKAGVYASTWFMGIATGGYVPVGLEFMSELTYPESENITAGLLMAASQLISVVMTVAYGWLVNVGGDWWANVALDGCLVVGLALTAAIKPELLRQKAAKDKHLQAVAIVADDHYEPPQ